MSRMVAFLLLAIFFMSPTVDSFPENLPDKTIDCKNEIETLLKTAGDLTAKDPYKAIQQGKEALKLLKKCPDTPLQFQTLDILSWSYKSVGDYQAALNILKMAEKLATKEDNKTELAKMFNVRGIVHWDANNYNQSIKSFLLAVDLWKKLGDQNNLAICLNNIGMVYKDIGDFERALQYNLDALKIQEKNGSTIDRAYTLSSIGTIHFELEKLPQAMDYYKKSLDIMQENSDQRGMADNLNNIGAVLVKKGDHLKALDFYLRSLEIEKKLSNTAGIAVSLNNIGELYVRAEDYEKALDFFSRSFHLAEKIDDKQGMIYPLINMSRILRKNGRYGKALKYAESAFDTATNINVKPLIGRACKELAESYAAMNNYKEAYRYHLAYKNINDELFNKDTNAKIAEMQAKYNLEAKEKEIQLLKQKEDFHFMQLEKQKKLMRIYFIAGFMIFVFGFVYFLLYYHKKKAQRAVEESEEKYRLLVENANVAIAILQQTVLKYVNPIVTDMLGYHPEELIEKPFDVLFAPSLLAQIKEKHQNRMAGHDVPIYETTLICKNGDKVDVEVTGNLITIEGRPAAMLFVRPIGHEKRVEAERLRTNKLESIGMLAEGIAHDFNNLLGVLLGNIELMRLKLKPDDNLTNNLNKFEKTTMEAKELIQQFLSFSKGGGTVKNREAMEPLLKKALDTALKHFDTTYRLNAGKNLWDVACDAEMFVRVFASFATNAAEAMQGKGRITIDAENLEMESPNELMEFSLEPGKYVKVTFKDNGEGIPTEHIPKIFDPYFSTRRRVSQRGLGFGLAIAYSTIKQHNGHIEVISELGVGTTITIYLPAAPGVQP